MQKNYVEQNVTHDKRQKDSLAFPLHFDGRQSIIK